MSRLPRSAKQPVFDRSVGSSDPAERPSKIPTPPPTFDVGRFAQTLETDLRPGAVLQKLDDSARRIELLSATLRAGGLSAEQAARALRSELRSIEARSSDPAVVGTTGPIAALAAAVRVVVESLGGIDRDPAGEERDVLVLDNDEVTRDLVVLAIEAQGHTVRTASTLHQFVALFHQQRPQVILSEAKLQEAPAESFCQFLRQTVGDDVIPIVLFTSAEGRELEEVAQTAGAERCICKDQGIEALVTEMNALFEEIIW
jgi:CheY-like chemotaxis protein